MGKFWHGPAQRRALVGDILVLAMMTVVGFASHGELKAGPRMLATFIPFVLAWLWVSPWFGLYEEDVLRQPRQVWRVLWAWSAGAPLGALSRALVLGREVVPVFVLVVFTLNGLALVLWRATYAWRRARRPALVR